MTKLDELKERLEPGRVYRRADLVKWSNAIDRHLQQLVKAGWLEKLSGGVYYCPKPSGRTRPNDRGLVYAFLKDSRFLIVYEGAYNDLGVGTTRHYDEAIVYNHKRHGRFKFGERTFDFRMKPYFPNIASREFLLVDLVNSIDLLAERRGGVLERIKKKAKRMNRRKLKQAVKAYAGVRTARLFESILD